jgi:hypothetical protein
LDLGSRREVVHPAAFKAVGLNSISDTAFIASNKETMNIGTLYKTSGIIFISVRKFNY